jgi:hypothetical protein
MDWRQVFLRVVNVTWTDLDSLDIILQLFNHFCIASGSVCRFREEMPGSLSVASTAVSSEIVADASYVEGGMSGVCSTYNSGPRAQPLGTPTLTIESSVYSVSTST